MDPDLSPETTKELRHSNSITASLCPLKRPCAHSSVLQFQTSKAESYPAEIATF